MARKKRKAMEGCGLDMTPMIDVVFQLIIFFVVTIKMDEAINEDIVLDDSKWGPVIEDQDPRTLVIEVDKKGMISIHNARLNHQMLAGIMQQRYKRMGSYPVLIRGDGRATHAHIKSVMDVCTASGIWRINFAAVNERKAKKK